MSPCLTHWRCVLLTLALTANLAACDNGIRVLNVAPSVAAIGPVATSGTDLSITVWVQDYETDAVDLQLFVVRGGNATELTELGGQGVNGLTSSRDAEGRPHVVLWTPPSDLSDGETIRLRAIPTDVDGDTGRTFESAEFTLSAGLPAP